LNFFQFGTILATLFVLAGNLNKSKGCVSRVQPEPGCRYGLLAQWPLKVVRIRDWEKACWTWRL